METLNGPSLAVRRLTTKPALVNNKPTMNVNSSQVA
jgi:hypothetical protein